MTEATVLSIRDLVFSYEADGQRALDGVRLEVRRGERVAILGYSGHGKTTLLNITGMLDRSASLGAAEAWSGSVTYRDHQGREHDLLERAGGLRRELLARDFGFVFQDTHLLPYLSAVDNVASRLVENGAPIVEARKRARQILLELGIDDEVMKRYPRQVSGGQRQRIAIARAVAHGPRVVLADEPTASLDPATARANLDLLRDWVDRSGATLLLVTHNFAEALAVCDRIVLVRNGAIAEDIDLAGAANPPTAQDLVRMLDGDTHTATARTVSAVPSSAPATGGKPTERLRWLMSCIFRDATDPRTRGFTLVTLMVVLLATTTLGVLIGLKKGTVDVLRHDVIKEPSFRRVDVTVDPQSGQSVILPPQLTKVRELPGVTSAIPAAVTSLSLVGKAQPQPTRVLDVRDWTWGLVSDSYDGSGFGIVLSREIAADLGIEGGDAWSDWESLGRRQVTAQVDGSAVQLPVLGVSPALELMLGVSCAVNGETAYYLEHWRPDLAHVLTKPDGQPIVPLEPRIRAEKLTLVSETERDWDTVLEAPAVTRHLEFFRGVWADLDVKLPGRGPTRFPCRLRWLRNVGGDSPWVKHAVTGREHEAWCKALIDLLADLDVTVERGGPVPADAPPPNPEAPEPRREHRMASVFVTDCWALPSVLAGIRAEGLNARSAVESALALLIAAERTLGLATIAALIVLLCLSVVAVGSAAYTLVERGRGEIGIHLANGATRRRVVAHFASVGCSIALVGALMGCVGAVGVGAAMRVLLDDFGTAIGGKLGFDLGWAAAGGLVALQVGICAVSVAIPCWLVTREEPARLLRSRVS